MSDDQETTFKRFRDAEDPGGNLAWSSKMASKAVGRSDSAPPDVEQWELVDGEKALWRLLKIARNYIDLENAGVLPTEKARSLLRGLVSAEVVDVVDAAKARPIIPLEIKRIVAKLAGGEVAPKKKGGRLKARVYRPDISGAAGDGTPPPSNVAPEPMGAKPVPAPVPAAVPPAKPASAPPEKRREPLVGKEKEMAAVVEQRFAAMAGQNHYQFLDIHQSAQPEGIKKAYMGLAKQLHPDHFAGSDLSPDLIEKADKLFKRLQNAWSTLNNDGQRSSYDSQIADGGGAPGAAGGKQRRPEEAKVMFMKAEHIAKAKQFGEAEKHYKTALQLDETLTAAKVGLGWAMFLNERRDQTERVAEAKQLLVGLVDKERDGDAAYKLALIARMEDNEAEHERRIRQAVKLSPRHQEALQESRLIARRKGPESKVKGGTGKKAKGGFFDRLKR